MKLNIHKGFHQIFFLDPDLENSNETLYVLSPFPLWLQSSSESTTLVPGLHILSSLFHNIFVLHPLTPTFHIYDPPSGSASPDILLYLTPSSKITLLFISFRGHCSCIHFLLHFVHMLFHTYSSSGACALTFVFKPKSIWLFCKTPVDTTGFGLNILPYSGFGLRCKTSLCFEDKYFKANPEHFCSRTFT